MNRKWVGVENRGLKNVGILWEGVFGTEEPKVSVRPINTTLTIFFVL